MNSDLLFVGLGSNLGERMDNLKEARRLLALRAKTIDSSTIIETDPVGVRTEKKFLNQVVKLEGFAETSAGKVMDWLLELEQKIGRNRQENKPDRVIDLDLLYLGQKVINSGPIVPHPRLHRRRFVLQPLVEIAPEFLHPVFKRTQRQLLNDLSQSGKQ